MLYICIFSNKFDLNQAARVSRTCFDDNLKIDLHIQLIKLYFENRILVGSNLMSLTNTFKSFVHVFIKRESHFFKINF
jgi:hypothetical protein